MPKYFYRARNRKGGIEEGAVLAANTWLARKAILKLNLIVLEVGRFNLATLRDFWKNLREQFRKRLSVDEKLVFLSQLETGYTVGIPLNQILQLLITEQEHIGFRLAIEEVARAVNEGSTLHEAFGNHPLYFDPVFVGMIRTGEMTGELESILGRLISMTEQQAQNRAKVKAAMFYPKIVLGFIVVAVSVIVYFVIPKLTVFLNTTGQELPAITKFVVNVSAIFTGYWYLLIAGSYAAHRGFLAFVSTPAGGLWIDQKILKIPGIGTIMRQLELNNFAVVLDLLLESGVPLSKGLEILAASHSNQVYALEVDRIRVEIERGQSLSKAMAPSLLFPGTFKSLLSVGEESGRLPVVLRRLGKYYQSQVDYRLDNLAKLIEPVLLGIIFFMVLILALAVFLPIWQLSSKPKL